MPLLRTMLRQHCFALSRLPYHTLKTGNGLLKHRFLIVTHSLKAQCRTLWMQRPVPDKSKDQVQDNETLAYVNSTAKQLVYTYTASVPILGLSVCKIAYNYMFGPIFTNFPMETVQYIEPYMEPLAASIMFAFVWSIKVFLDRSPLWMYYDESNRTFTAIKCSPLVQRKRIQFLPEDVKKMNVVEGSFRSSLGNYKINGETSIVFNHGFKNVRLYNIFCGAISR